MSDDAPPGTAADPAAVYLARCLIADHGYVPGHVAEAAPLAEACDIVLTSGNEDGLVIACIVDRDRHPGRRFELPADRLEEIADACRHHAGRFLGLRRMTTVEIWEIGASDAADHERLKSYTFRRRSRHGVQVKAYAVDSATGALFSTAGDAGKRAPWLRQILTEPRRDRATLAASVAERRKAAARFHAPPRATLALIAALVAMFAVELLWALVPATGLTTPGVPTLVAFGALDRAHFVDGEWWRLLTCAFLHGSFVHLLSNSVALLMAGSLIESLAGRAWMLALFVLGAVGGSVLSLAINPSRVVSVGASGAVMGMMAAALVLSLRLPHGPARTRLMVTLGYILVLSLVPLFSQIDYAAHIGGALTGAAIGGLLLLTWRRTDDHPRGRRLAALLAAAGLAYTAVGIGSAIADRDAYQRLADLPRLLAPDALLANPDEAALIATAPALLADYPRDPRVLYLAGEHALASDDAAAAITYYQRALAEQELLRLIYGDKRHLDDVLRRRLAQLEAPAQR